MQRRAFFVGLIFSIFIFIYLIRLLILQAIPTSFMLHSIESKYKHSNWKRMAVTQRSKQLQFNDGRAIFLDQHHMPIQSESYMTVAFFPVKAWQAYSLIQYTKLAEILGKSPNELRAWLLSLHTADYLLDEKKLPIVLNSEQIVKLQQIKMEGFELVPFTARNGHQGSYRHIIGFTGEHPEWTEKHYEKEINELAYWDRNAKVGVNGLEHSLDRLLHGLGPSYLSYTLDGKSHYMAGIGPRIVESNNAYYPLQVVTTIDLQLQESVEQLMEQHEIAEGAIVLLDAINGDIKAMVSRPSLKPDSWAEINSESWRNHALTAYEPGSIYKIVTAAAALEYGVVSEEEHFHCDGEYGKYGLSCWKKGGHGTQTLAEGFANSCNIVFATIAERLTPQQLHDTATALGVIYPVGWHTNEPISPFTSPLRLLEEEERGVALLDLNTWDSGILAQTGIGQRDARITPLQAANMLVTIIHNGKQFQTRSAMSINYRDGLPLLEFPIQLGHEHRYRIHPSTANRLMEYMNKVVESGTGQALKQSSGEEASWRLAGKSGTAQLSGELKGLNNQWFIGYGPADKPKYAAAVFIRKAKANTRNQATLLFKEVMRLAEQHDQ